MKVAYTRCAACGSSRVKSDSKNEGYSVGKGVAGAVLFGPAGAAMGVNGKKKTYFHCPDCGQVLSYSMPQYIVSSINDYMINPEKYRVIKRMYKDIYPNVDWDDDVSSGDTKSCSVDEHEDTDEELADKIWAYYIEKRLPFVSEEELEEKLDKWFLYSPIKILESKGLVVRKFVQGVSYIYFYDNADDIQYNMLAYKFCNQNNILYSNDYDDKKLFTNIFQMQHAGKEYSLEEFYDIIANYIVEKEYILKDGKNDILCKKFFKSLNDTYRIEVNDKKNIVKVWNLDDSKKYYLDFKEKMRKAHEEKVSKVASTIMKVLKKEDYVTEKILAVKYSDFFDGSSTRVISEALKKLVKECKIYEFGLSKYFCVYSLNTTIPAGVKVKDFEQKYRMINWMLDKSNKEKFESLNVYKIIKENEPVFLKDIYNKCGNEKAYVIDDILKYYIYVDKSIVDYGLKYWTTETYLKMIEEKKAKELENKYLTAVNNYDHCLNVKFLEKYINDLKDLGDYKDSKKVIKDIEERIIYLKEVEAERIKQEEIARIEREKYEQEQEQERKKKNKKLMKIIVSISIVVILGFIILCGFLIKNTVDVTEQNRIADKLDVSFSSVSKEEGEKLPDGIKKEAWDKYSPYVGKFEYYDEISGEYYTIISDFYFVKNNTLVWVLRDEFGEVFSSYDKYYSDYPFAIYMNKERVYFFEDYNLFEIEDGLIESKKLENDYLQATISFKNNKIVYNVGIYQTTTNTGKRENWKDLYTWEFVKR